jgi:heme/copper-type cytochrome/quinol oxidase subunit 1
MTSIMYCVTCFMFFIGGLMALLMRAEGGASSAVPVE